MSDNVNHPKHYNQVPGIECLDVVKHFSFLRGNALKYLWRADHKNGLEDLKKALFYVQAEIAELEPQPVAAPVHRFLDDEPIVVRAGHNNR